MISHANETVAQCPIGSRPDTKEFLVVVHNPNQFNSNFARIKLPHNRFKAKVWYSKQKKFIKVHSDILEQASFVESPDKNQNGKKQFVDFEMFLPTFINKDFLLYRITEIENDKLKPNSMA